MIKFNGTESLGDFFETLKDMVHQESVAEEVVETNNKLVFNVAGFDKSQIEVFYKDETIEVVCNGSSPFYGNNLVIRKYAPFLKNPKITYEKGCVIVESKGIKEPTKLDFDTENLFD